MLLYIKTLRVILVAGNVIETENKIKNKMIDVLDRYRATSFRWSKTALYEHRMYNDRKLLTLVVYSLVFTLFYSLLSCSCCILSCLRTFLYESRISSFLFIRSCVSLLRFMIPIINFTVVYKKLEQPGSQEEGSTVQLYEMTMKTT